MANDRAVAPRPSRVTDALTLSGLLDVLDRAELQPARSGFRPGRAALHRTGVARRPAAVRPVPVPAARPRPLVAAPAAPAAPAPAWTAPAPAPAARGGLRARVRVLVRRLALWGAGPDGAHLAWGRPAAPAPRPDGPVVLTELPNTPTVQPAAPSPAAALRPARVPRPAARPRVPVVPPLARQVPAPRPAPAPRTAQAGRPPGAARASAPARARGDPRPPPARGQPPGW
jgi:hypothetical protein